MGFAAVFCHYRALALACRAAPQRFSTVFFHSRACRTLSNAHRRTRGGLVAFRLGIFGRDGALDRAYLTRAGERLAGSPRPIPPDFIPVDLGSLCLPVFLALRLETHALHSARDAGLGGADRSVAIANPEAGSAADGHPDDGYGAGVGRGELRAAKPDPRLDPPVLLFTAGEADARGRRAVAALGAVRLG